MAEWISVKDRLPKDGACVLIVVYDSYYWLAWRDNGSWETDDERFEDDVVKYWRPLPEPPKGENNV